MEEFLKDKNSVFSIIGYKESEALLILCVSGIVMANEQDVSQTKTLQGIQDRLLSEQPHLEEQKQELMEILGNVSSKAKSKALDIIVDDATLPEFEKSLLDTTIDPELSKSSFGGHLIKRIWHLHTGTEGEFLGNHIQDLEKEGWIHHETIAMTSFKKNPNATVIEGLGSVSKKQPDLVPVTIFYPLMTRFEEVDEIKGLDKPDGI